MSLNVIQQQYLEQYINKRPGEEKIGEVINTYQSNWREAVKESNAQYVIIGMVEDIGPRANHGRGGANDAWEAFLNVFLNMQNNRHIEIETVDILGFFDFQNSVPEDAGLNQLRSKVEDIDHEVSEVLKVLYQAGKTPILIGGGHNNAYPLMKAFSEVNTTKKLGVVNLDPHADFRPLEGRHSGNSFSTAFEQKFLFKYGVMGLHKSYNSENMLADMDQKGCQYFFFDDIVHGKSSLGWQFESILDYLEDSDSIGIELDLDSIKNMPVSAFTSSGISLEDARSYIYQSSRAIGDRVVYYNLTEAAPKHAENGKIICGKALAYLVFDILHKD